MNEPCAWQLVHDGTPISTIYLGKQNAERALDEFRTNRMTKNQTWELRALYASLSPERHATLEECAKICRSARRQLRGLGYPGADWLRQHERSEHHQSPRGTMKRPKKGVPWMARQGDVLIVAVGALPANAVERKRTKRGVVLAEGEVTGHAHTIVAHNVIHYDAPNAGDAARQLLADAGMRLELHEGAAVSFVDVGVEAPLTHEEHGTITVPAGPKVVIIQREWSDADEPRQVLD